MTVTFAPVHDDAEIDKTISIFAREPGGGLICPLDSFTLTHRDVIVSEAASHGIPLIGGNLGFPGVGGLMTYWPDLSDEMAKTASYIDRILNGASPADLPADLSGALINSAEPNFPDLAGSVEPPKAAP